MARGGVDRENLIPGIEPERVEGVKLKKGKVSGGVSNRVYNTLMRSGAWTDKDGEIYLGVLAEHSEEMIAKNTPNLNKKGVGEIKQAVRDVAEQKGVSA